MEPVTYFDHAATSWPKPEAVRHALERYFGPAGGNPGRSGHRMSIEASRVVEEAREVLAALFNVADTGRVVLTKNATEALNLAIYGLVAPGDHAVTTTLEHTSVMRPLRDLEARGLELTVVRGRPDGTIDPEEVAAALRPNTKLLTTVHGSNVTGALVPITELGTVARSAGVPYLVDAAQTAGVLPIDPAAAGVDLLAFTGHKGLLGLTGTGGLVVGEGVSPRPLMRCGTGSKSDRDTQPEFLPDFYESGTLNVAGLAGLAAGVRHLLDLGIERVHGHERKLVARFLEGASGIGGVRLHGPEGAAPRCGVVSFTVDGLVSSEVSTLLDREFGILSRPGLHCAPGTHQTIGTFPTGTVRFGFGLSNTEDEVEGALGAIAEIAAWAGSLDAGEDADD
jgi:cysteine desulfurase family protein